jgi:hypothetical protein
MATPRTGREANSSHRPSPAPDTLDLAERASVAINGLGGTLDPAMECLPFGQVHFSCRRPVMHHWSSADLGCGAKALESFPLMRIMSGSRQHEGREAILRENLMARVKDGLFWDTVDARRPWRTTYGDSDRRYGTGRNEDFCIPSHAARMMRAVMVTWQATGDEQYRRAAEELAGGMRGIAIDKDDYSYYPEKGGWGEPTTYPRSGWMDTADARDETEGVEGSITGYHAHPVYAAGLWHRLTGSAVALDLAHRMARYCMQPRFWGGVPDPDRGRARAQGLPEHIAARLPDPACTAGPELGHWYSHFHARATVLRGLLEYGRAAGDDRALEFVRRGYEFTLGQGIARTGWINCYPGATNTMEGCATGDLVALAIRLTDAGLGDYWDDVDAIVRNQLVEAQLVDAGVLRRIASAAAADRDPASFRPGEASFERVIDSSLGIFAGLFQPAGAPLPWSMLCCTGNGTQGLYYAWEAIVREDGDHAQVNLLLNRSARLLDVDSWLPFEGRVEVRTKGARRIALRIPHWVDRRALRAELTSRSVTPDWVGNHVVFGGLEPGDVISLAFPVPTTTVRSTINANTDQEMLYTCTFRGSTCVSISPRDDAPTSYPFYRRDNLLAEKAPMKTVERFVAERLVREW